MQTRFLEKFVVASILLGVGATAAHAQSYNAPTVHQVCHNVRVQDKPSDNHQIAGTAVGAVAGGVLGHQIGSGKGNTLATVGGAVAGGVVGKKVQENHQENNATYHYEKRCYNENG